MLKYKTGSKEKNEYSLCRLLGQLRKRRFKKAVVSAVTAACILAGSGVFTGFSTKALAEGVNKADLREVSDTGDLSGKTVILHSNDVHGTIDGYARIAALKKTMEDKGAEVIEADAGDYSSETPGEDAFGALEGFMMMRLAGYDVATFGDAEFAQGYDKVRHDVGGSKIRLICANAFKDDRNILSPSYVHQTAKGQKIGFVGITGPADGSADDGIDILSGDDMYECAKAEADSLKKSGVNTVIALTHLGTEGGAEGNSLDLSSRVDSIDFVIDGHSHGVVTEGPGGEPVQSAGEGFAYIGVVVLDKNGKVEDNYIMSTKNIEPDASVQKEADKFKKHMTVAEISDGEDLKAASVKGASDKDEADEDTAKAKNGKDRSASKNSEGAEDAENDSDGTEDKAIVKDNVDNKAADSNTGSAGAKKDNSSAAGSGSATELGSAAGSDTKDAADKKETGKASGSDKEEAGKVSGSDMSEQGNATDEKNTASAGAGEDSSAAEASEEKKTEEEQITLKDGKYEVVKGDCLWKIAEKHLGDGARWNEIYELNKGVISNPSLIYVGQQLVLPPG